MSLNLFARETKKNALDVIAENCYKMHSSSLDTEGSSSLVKKDGDEALVTIATLVTEGRIPGKSGSKTKKFYEGPHCTPHKPQPDNEHHCDLTDPLCKKYNTNKDVIRKFWRKKQPLCIEVVLHCACKERKDFDSDILLEQWYFTTNYNRTQSKLKKYVAAFTGTLPLPLLEDVEPPKAPSPDVLSQLIGDSVFADGTNLQDYIDNSEDEERKSLTQTEMDYIVAKMNLSQRNSEFLTSYLKHRKLTEHNDNNDILLPPLHIKLGIVKKFIEVAVKDDDEVFDCLKTIFPKLSNDKIKHGVLNGPDIRKLTANDRFTKILKNDHRNAWDALKAVIEGVLGKNRVQRDEVKKLVGQMLYYFPKINVSMTLKLHFLYFHLDEFLEQLPTESDEQGERFHQVTMPMEKRYRGKSWMHCLRKSSGPPFFNVQQLTSAIRSQLYFSQIAAWLTSQDDNTPCKIDRRNLSYRLVQRPANRPDTTKFSLPAVKHDFPLTDVANGCALNVTFLSLPRMSSTPNFACEQCFLIDRILDDRMHVNCTLKGKHRCEDLEEFVNVAVDQTNFKRLCSASTSTGMKMDLKDKGQMLLDAIERSAEERSESDSDLCDMNESDIFSIKKTNNKFKCADMHCDSPIPILRQNKKILPLVHKAKQKITFDDEDDDKKVDIPTALEQAKFRKNLDNAASMVFHSRTGLPLTSSPAPVRRGKNCFDFDSSINSVYAIRSALFSGSFSTDEESESEGSIVSPCSPEIFAGDKKSQVAPPVKYRRKGHAANLLGW
ncbi:unnamed protein product [Brassicogethes aeneus]|uniref:Uncharacterized protein n=1 Tax=Brassicogethes aeneus TaxID=1431903 RepID=A0A9P0B1P1_BRAAE|nr:unnamed protein product [Brassicogethes aeneus]